MNVAVIRNTVKLESERVKVIKELKTNVDRNV